MNTKIILTSSTIFLGLIGIGLTFLPEEILSSLSVKTNFIVIVFMQILGALMLGFAIMNWMSREALFGGIYNKPIVIGNFMHFAVGAMALIKIVFRAEQNVEIIIGFTIIYMLFALCFGYVFMNNPKVVSEK
jgi:hypothetical protein